MKRFYTFHFLFWGLGLLLSAQTVIVEKPVVTPSQEKYKVVEASKLLHTIEGATAVYKISVEGFDSIVSVKSLRYNNTNITSNCHLDKGILTIDDVTISNLKAGTTQDFKITLVAREKGKEVDTERSADAMGVKVYSVPSGKEVESPKYLTYYKDSEENLTWKFKGTGGNSWNCTWNIDKKDNNGNSFTVQRIREAKNSELKLTAINLAPDGKTEWDRYEENWQIVVLPEAIVQPSEDDNASEEFFQDQEWPLSVSVEGGNSLGWEYSWTIDDVKSGISGNSYTLFINESERSTDIIERKVVLNVKNNLPEGTKPTKEELEWTYNYSAKFYPCPEVRFAENYPQNICDEDIITFAFVILDGQGNSLLHDPDYEWYYSWGDGKETETYLFEGKNVENTEGDVHTITCVILGKLKGIEKPYTRTLLHKVTVWPKPVVYPLSEGESHHVSCGGRSLSVSINTFGGQKDGWEYYYGKKGETPLKTKDNTLVFSIERESQRDTCITEEYIMRAVNHVDGDIRCDRTLSMTVDVYPAPWMPNDVVIKDNNRQNASAESGIRVGNKITLFCEDCYGGYPYGWSCSWSKDDNIISNSYETTTSIEEVYQGDMKSDDRTISFRCDVSNYYGSEPWVLNEYVKQLTIYNKPITPASLTKKGNGNSGTMIATTSVSDTDLEGHEYYLVFGYIDSNGQMHDTSSQRQKNAGEVRWSTQIPSSEIENSSNTYVYALWKYNNGVEITSGLRYANRVDEDWDGSSYSGTTRTVLANTTEINNVNIQLGEASSQEYYSVNGLKLHGLSKGLNIVRMSDGKVKKVIIK